MGSLLVKLVRNLRHLPLPVLNLRVSTLEPIAKNEPRVPDVKLTGTGVFSVDQGVAYGMAMDPEDVQMWAFFGGVLVVMGALFILAVQAITKSRRRMWEKLHEEMRPENREKRQKEWNETKAYQGKEFINPFLRAYRGEPAEPLPPDPPLYRRPRFYVQVLVVIFALYCGYEFFIR